MKKTLVIAGVSLLALAATAALGRDWDDAFTALAPSVKQPGHYEWGWNGNDSLVLQVPAVMHYTPGGKPGIVITGAEELLAHVEVGEGRIRMERDWHWDNFNHERLQVTVTGVTVHNIAVSGSGEAHLEKLNLDHLNLAVSGSGSVTGDGRSDALRVSLSGSGHADITGLAARDTDMNISGSGVVTEGGHGEHLKLNISGSGRADLSRSQIRDAVIRMSGSGKVAIGGGIEHLDLSSSGAAQVDLGKLQAQDASIHMTGAGTVTGAGRSDHVMLTLSGKGRMELAQLETRNADIHLSGSGMVAITPRDSANVSISGSGTVHMRARPARLEQSINGSGGVRVTGD